MRENDDAPLCFCGHAEFYQNGDPIHICECDGPHSDATSGDDYCAECRETLDRRNDGAWHVFEAGVPADAVTEPCDHIFAPHETGADARCHRCGTTRAVTEPSSVSTGRAWKDVLGWWHVDYADGGGVVIAVPKAIEAAIRSEVETQQRERIGRLREALENARGDLATWGDPMHDNIVRDRMGRITDAIRADAALSTPVTEEGTR